MTAAAIMRPGLRKRANCRAVKEDENPEQSEMTGESGVFIEKYLFPVNQRIRFHLRTPQSKRGI
jgi:hypothetical protein